MKTNRRSFLKFLSVSPAIFQALPAFAEFLPKSITENNINQSLSDSSPVIGTLKYDLNQEYYEIYTPQGWSKITLEERQNA